MLLKTTKPVVTEGGSSRPKWTRYFDCLFSFYVILHDYLFLVRIIRRSQNGNAKNAFPKGIQLHSFKASQDWSFNVWYVKENRSRCIWKSEIDIFFSFFVLCFSTFIVFSRSCLLEIEQVTNCMPSSSWRKKMFWEEIKSVLICSVLFFAILTWFLFTGCSCESWKRYFSGSRQWLGCSTLLHFSGKFPFLL